MTILAVILATLGTGWRALCLCRGDETRASACRRWPVQAPRPGDARAHARKRLPRNARMSPPCSRTSKRTAPPSAKNPPCAGAWNRQALPQGFAARLLDDLRHPGGHHRGAVHRDTAKPAGDHRAVFVVGLGLPRWVLEFLAARRRKKFTGEFRQRHRRRGAFGQVGPAHGRGAAHRRARGAQSGRQRIHHPGRRHEGRRDPGTGMKRMLDSMPTPEVGFFAIVMTIQAKSGGNLSEALGNLAGVLRDRKRLRGKIKAMSFWKPRRRP
ncbi:MAG: type II secretion system F family protein [Alphaproteobacteria bacterium]|nr:type II secretion system F family protein [Alphaproteobacteria bacterium]